MLHLEYTYETKSPWYAALVSTQLEFVASTHLNDQPSDTVSQSDDEYNKPLQKYFPI